MRIIFSKHALQKIKERKIKVEVIEEVVSNPEFLFYDLIEKTMVAVAKVKIDDIQTSLVVVFIKKGEEIKIVTTYPCRNINKEIKRKEGIRWVRM
ncbi:DUF4258 domain-containing protein [Candidatus Calescamantes bacterium]|nr:DUF4258 domain-containing protein [Candidatus Calescamantes bacterium]